MKQLRALAMCVLITTAFLPSKSNAQVVAAEIALTGLTAKQIISKFESAASRLLQEGENRGNALMVQMGNQLRVATQNASIALAAQQNTTFENLGKTEQSFLRNSTRLFAQVRAR